MDRFVIEGGARLSGTLKVDGSKNPADLMTKVLTMGEVELRLKEMGLSVVN